MKPDLGATLWTWRDGSSPPDSCTAAGRSLRIFDSIHAQRPTAADSDNHHDAETPGQWLRALTLTPSCEWVGPERHADRKDDLIDVAPTLSGTGTEAVVRAQAPVLLNVYNGARRPRWTLAVDPDGSRDQHPATRTTCPVTTASRRQLTASHGRC